MSGLLSRWNQRREDVAKEAEQPELAQNEPTKISNASAANEKSTAESQDVTARLETEEHFNQADSTFEPEDANALPAQALPDPESIEVGGSFASFMAKNVDPATRAAALKALWKQPQYGHIDGLLEYALDYTNQPKLSAEMSAELAKKIFKHVIEKQDVAEEMLDDEKLAAQDATSSDQLIADEPIDDEQVERVTDDATIDDAIAKSAVDQVNVSTETIENVDANNVLTPVAAQPDELQSRTITGDAVITG